MNFDIFFCSPGRTNEFHLLRLAMSYTETGDNKGKHKIFLGTNVFPRYTVTIRTSSDQSSYEPFARGAVFNFPAVTRNEKNRKYQTN